MFGSHLSIAGGMHHALLEAEKLGLECVQVFTKNQQQWKAPPLARDAIDAWWAELRRLGWAPAEKGGAPVPDRVTSHASYLINMGSPDEALREKSIALMRDEIERCEVLGITLLVFHPGASTGGTREGGVALIADACARLIAETRGYRTVLCLENVAGAGTTIGRTFEELADLRARVVERTGEPQRVGFCMDTCHAHAAGYDLSTPAAAQAALELLDASVGLANVRILHVNDSKGACGSHLDRHDHIGHGTIGLSRGGGFGAWVGAPGWRNIPKIMETPKGDHPDGLAWDVVNVRALRAMLDPAGAASVPAGATDPANLKARTPAKAKASPKAKSGAKPTSKPAKPEPAKPKAPSPGSSSRKKKKAPARSRRKA